MTEHKLLIRRVVAHTGPDDLSRIQFDGLTPHIHSMIEFPTMQWTDIWATGTAADADHQQDAGDVVDVFPKVGETRCRLVSILPDPCEIRGWDKTKGPHPLMHKTPTVDIVYMISGEVTCILDDGEVALRPGDCYVQRSTNHAWSNRTDKPALFLGLLVGSSNSQVS